MLTKGRNEEKKQIKGGNRGETICNKPVFSVDVYSSIVSKFDILVQKFYLCNFRKQQKLLLLLRPICLLLMCWFTVGSLLICLINVRLTLRKFYDLCWHTPFCYRLYISQLSCILFLGIFSRVIRLALNNVFNRLC